MGDDAAHARLSPSKASRYMRCPGSVILEDQCPNTSSKYADEGTAAHSLAEMVLTSGTDAEGFVGRRIDVGTRTFEVDMEMADHVNTYAATVRSFADQIAGTILVEQKLPIGHLTGEEGATGTSDVVILGETELQVHDLKYGKGVRVDAEDNEQLQKYALGALEEYGLIADFETVRMVIHMPRLDHVSEWSIPVDHLRIFGDEVRAAAQRVGHADSDFELNGGFASGSESAEMWLKPGEKQCRFCRAKAICPALQGQVAKTVGGAALVDEFADLDDSEPTFVAAAETIAEATANASKLYNEALGAKLRLVDMIEEWCAAIRARAHSELLAGRSVEGFKLVEGKRGNRAWIDAKEAEAALKAMRMPVDEMYDKTLISPTTAEKRLKDSPRKWAKVEKLITRADGKPAVAPADDKRPALVVAPVADDFGNLDAAELEGADLA